LMLAHSAFISTYSIVAMPIDVCIITLGRLFRCSYGVDTPKYAQLSSSAIIWSDSGLAERWRSYSFRAPSSVVGIGLEPSCIAQTGGRIALRLLLERSLIR
jgi:hypothetical protein